MNHDVTFVTQKKATKVTITMSIDEAKALEPFLGRFELSKTADVLGLDENDPGHKHTVTYTNEAIYQLYASLNSATRTADREENGWKY